MTNDAAVEEMLNFRWLICTVGILVWTTIIALSWYNRTRLYLEEESRDPDLIISKCERAIDKAIPIMSKDDFEEMIQRAKKRHKAAQ